MSNIEYLKQLYHQQSKHANYQSLSPSVLSLIGEELRSGQPKYEAERFSYMAQKISLTGKSILDIGANTGYFSLRAFEQGAGSVTAFEGNADHAKFLSLTVQSLNIPPHKVRVVQGYFNQQNISKEKQYDVIFLLNVIHHLGDDYGNPQLSKEQFFEDTAKFLQGLAYMGKILVLQIGYCWKGNRELSLFPEGTKQNQLDFLQKVTNGFWRIEHVGIAEKAEKGMAFSDMSARNMIRDDRLKEFLNRPIFILRSTINEVE